MTAEVGAGRGAGRLGIRSGSAFGALFAAQFAAAAVPYGIGALAPYLSRNVGLSAGEVGLATAIIYVFVVVASIPAGRVVDRTGVAIGIAASCVVVAGGTLGLAVADDRAGLAFALGVIGLGYSAISPATNKGVLAVAPRPLRGRAMGIKQMGVTVGGAVAAALLPTSVARYGFAATVSVAAACVAVIGLLAATWLRGSRDLREDRPPPSPVDAALRRRIVVLGVAIATMVAAQHCAATYLTLFLVERRSMPAAAAAGLLSLMLVCGTAARFGWGWVSDRIGSRLATMVLIGGVSAASSIAIGVFGPSVPWGVLILLVVALGIATQGGNAVFQTAIAEEAPDRAGWASGVGMSLGFTGAIVAPPLFGATVDATGSFALAFAGAAAIVGVGVALTRHLERTQGPTDHMGPARASARA